MHMIYVLVDPTIRMQISLSIYFQSFINYFV